MERDRGLRAVLVQAVLSIGSATAGLLASTALTMLTTVAISTARR